MIVLWIKGSLQDAMKTSEKMNMPLLTIDEYEPVSKYKMVKARVFSHHLNSIVAAYCEDGAAPYPPGSIVFYKEETAL